MADDSKRESVRWVEALDRLVEWGWVKAVGYKGEIFELTGTGYSKADWLKDGMRIDTSKDLKKPVLILDDICTTGATFEEMIKILKKHGINEVVCMASSSPIC